MRESIRYSSEPMEELLSQWGIVGLGERSTGDDRQPSLVAWCDNHGLSREDGMILERFVAGFGLADVEGAMRYCDEYRDVMDERLQQAREELRNKGRVWMALGTCGGLAAGLLLL